MRARDFELSNSIYYGAPERRSGICMALSCFWVRECFGAGGVPPANPFANWRDYLSVASVFVDTLSHYNLDGGDANIVSHQTLGQQSLKWHRLYFQQLGMHLAEVNWGSGAALDGLVSIVESAPSGAYLLTYYGTATSPTGQLGVRGGHTVALWYDAGHKAFFDPNYGQYSAVRGDVPWAAEVAAHVAQYNISDQVLLYSVT